MSTYISIHPHEGLKVEVADYSSFACLKFHDGKVEFTLNAEIKDLEDLKTIAELMRKIWPERVEQQAEELLLDNEIPF